MNRINLLFNILIGIFIIAFTFVAVQVNAQTVGEIYADGEEAYLILGEDAELIATNFTFTESANGNYTINATWDLSDGNSFVPEKGVNKVYLETYFNNEDDGKGDFDVIELGSGDNSSQDNMASFEVQAKATINKNGKCHAVIHYKQ